MGLILYSTDVVLQQFQKIALYYVGGKNILLNLALVFMETDYINSYLSMSSALLLFPLPTGQLSVLLIITNVTV